MNVVDKIEGDCSVCGDKFVYWVLQDRFDSLILCTDHYISLKKSWNKWRFKAERIRKVNKRMKENNSLGVRWMLIGDVKNFKIWKKKIIKC